MDEDDCPLTAPKHCHQSQFGSPVQPSWITTLSSDGGLSQLRI
jgi:hypothetical protein